MRARVQIPETLIKRQVTWPTSNPRAMKWEPKEKGLSQPTRQLTWALQDAPGQRPSQTRMEGTLGLTPYVVLLHECHVCAPHMYLSVLSKDAQAVICAKVMCWQRGGRCSKGAKQKWGLRKSFCGRDTRLIPCRWAKRAMADVMSQTVWQV